MCVPRAPKVKKRPRFLDVGEVLSGFPVTPILVSLTNNKAHSLSRKVFFVPLDSSFACFMTGLENRCNFSHIQKKLYDTFHDHIVYIIV